MKMSKLSVNPHPYWFFLFWPFLSLRFGSQSWAMSPFGRWGVHLPEIKSRGRQVREGGREGGRKQGLE